MNDLTVTVRDLEDFLFSFPAVNIGPPKVLGTTNGSGFGYQQPSGSGGSGERKRLPNMALIASINASLAKKSSDNPMPPSSFSAPAAEDKEDGAERKRKRKSRWGTESLSERMFIPGMPTVLPANLSKEQEEAYIRKSNNNF